jgi:hypothetical protein
MPWPCEGQRFESSTRDAQPQGPAPHSEGRGLPHFIPRETTVQYDKTIKDTYGDDAVVEAGNGGNVYLHVGADGDMSYTPAQARALAKALKRAANVAEGKPAKPAKAKKVQEIAGPEIVENRIGIQLHRNADGTYSAPDCREIGGPCMFAEDHLNVSLERILADGGRVV